MTRRHERPLRRKNPGGNIVWVARWTDRDGHRTSAGTYALRGPCRDPQGDGTCCAQHRIDRMYEAERAALAGPQLRPSTVGHYAQDWPDHRPRTPRTNLSYRTNVRGVLDVEMSDGHPFRDVPMAEVRRRHVNELVTWLLVEKGRARSGALLVVSCLRAMWADAIEDEVVEINPFMGVRIAQRDPRVRRDPRPRRVFSWDRMHAFAASAASLSRDDGWAAWRTVYAEPLIRALSDCGLRIGEALALERSSIFADGCRELWCPARRVDDEPPVPHIHVMQHAWRTEIILGTKSETRRAAPLPPRLGGLLASLPPRIDTRLVFPSPEGGVLSDVRFYDHVWRPTRAATGMDCTPHEFRHSFVSLVAPSVDQADLAAASGHTVETMNRTYRHALGRSFDVIAGAVEE